LESSFKFGLSELFVFGEIRYLEILFHYEEFMTLWNENLFGWRWIFYDFV